MTDANPYAAPTVEDQSAFTPGERDFAKMTDKEVKKLYYRSCNVAGIGLLLALGCIVLVVMMANGGGPGGMGSTETAIIGGILLFYTLAIVGIFMRTNWGRVLGIIACVLALINIPIGTIIGIIGIIGLVAFCSAPQLFGSDRITHKAAKAEFKHRKQEAKRRKREAKAGR